VTLVLLLRVVVDQVNVPRRIDWRVMSPNQISIMFDQELPTGVKWNMTLGLAASQERRGIHPPRLASPSDPYRSIQRPTVGSDTPLGVSDGLGMRSTSR